MALAGCLDAACRIETIMACAEKRIQMSARCSASTHSGIGIVRAMPWWPRPKPCGLMER
jgi:hypothetical protein